MVVSFCLCYGGERGHGQPDFQAVSQAARTASGQHLPLCLPRHLHLLLRRLFHHLQPLRPTVNGVSNVFCFSIFSPWNLHAVAGPWCPQSHLLFLLQILRSTCCCRSVMSSKPSTSPSSDLEVYMLLPVRDVLKAIYFSFFRSWGLHAVAGQWCPQSHLLLLLQTLRSTCCCRSVMSSKPSTFPSSDLEVYMLLPVRDVLKAIYFSFFRPWGLHAVAGPWCPQSHLLLLLQTLKSTCCCRSVMSSKSSTSPSSGPEDYIRLPIYGALNVTCFSFFSPWSLHTVDCLWRPRSHLLFLLQPLKSTCCWRSVMSSKSSTFPSSALEKFFIVFLFTLWNIYIHRFTESSKHPVLMCFLRLIHRYLQLVKYSPSFIGSGKHPVLLRFVQLIHRYLYLVSRHPHLLWSQASVASFWNKPFLPCSSSC